MFAGPLSPGAAQIVKYFSNVIYGALSHTIDCLTYLLWILKPDGHQNCTIGSKVMAVFVELL